MKSFEEEWNAPFLRRVLSGYLEKPDIDYICIAYPTFMDVWEIYADDIWELARESGLANDRMVVGTNNTLFKPSNNVMLLSTHERREIRIKFLEHEIHRLESLQG